MPQFIATANVPWDDVSALSESFHQKKFSVEEWRVTPLFQKNEQSQLQATVELVLKEIASETATEIR